MRSGVALGGVALMVGLGAVLVGSAMQGQEILQASGPLPSFEVVSIRPWKPATIAGSPPPPPAADGSVARPRGPMKVDPIGGVERGQRSDRMHFIGQTVLLIASAYGLPPGKENMVVGAPGWAQGGSPDLYDVQAKIDAASFTAMQAMPPAEQRKQVELMEQSLLAERFKLQVHFETREMPAYSLVVARGGAKLTRAKAGGTSRMYDAVEGDHGSELKAESVTMEQVTHSVLLFQGRRVVDKTGLMGAYDFTLTYGREQPDALGDGSDAPPVLTAMEEQLGLKLVEGNAAVEVIVVDHVERPGEN
jgi:uncharacterized protein (TIGR03435 family)